MADLAIPSFEIHGFRGFDDLRIERFGRVNLIVGKNNVGKTSLLEAIQIYSSGGDPTTIRDVLEIRDEYRQRSQARFNGDSEAMIQALSFLFYGRPDLNYRSAAQIHLGIINDASHVVKLSVELVPSREWIERKPSRAPAGVVDETLPALGIRWGSHGRTRLDVDAFMYVRGTWKRDYSIPCKFVSARGTDNADLATLWDDIALTNLESNVLEGLRVIAPGIERLAFIADERIRRSRVPVIKVSNISDPLPLRSLGDGMQRMLSLALALANTREGVLLIDEIENGLHYLILAQMWKLIFETARRLNVQVFATTHSWDCIKAFQQAADDDTKSEGLLIRLELKQDKIVPVLISEEDLRIVTQEEIEVR